METFNWLSFSILKKYIELLYNGEKRILNLDRKNRTCLLFRVENGIINEACIEFIPQFNYIPVDFEDEVDNSEVDY